MTTELAVLPLLVDPRRVASARGAWSRSPLRAGAREIALGRQGIFSPRETMVCSELAAQMAGNAPLYVDFRIPVQPDDVTEQVVTAALDGPRQASSPDDRPVFVNVTRAFLLGDRMLRCDPERLVVQLVEPLKVDEELIACVAGLRARGFRIALSDFVGLSGQCRLLPLADFVMIDARDLDVEGAPLLALARSHGAQLVAQHVDSDALHLECRCLGFELYQGDALEPMHQLSRTERAFSERCG